ncbi:hypothetical protein ABL78_0467 [Leptomonas seymouri]|uniref:Uncharacterized protein n=1 Tax=Leptomonas seymouri TaxID=5684 RepID=A0A0N1PDU5_LEPSE|nr:hypothetical protein ABL78_0467 [Leptomonas seymouri]|eukprot:KPI90391.1 hypothetical protein ABL78_0467 [Leptomonas seymouri]
MTSSFAAQNRGSHNAHQNPVRSHKGGYLRCPFNISASYAELAEKRVRDDLARGGMGARGAAAVADKDGLLSSSTFSSSASRQVNGDDGFGGSEGRPWSRAGVGSNKLSSKEKRTQQEQAELIYGRGSLAHGDDATAGAASMGHGPSQENMFAVDSRDQAALQKVVPRAVREKVKRRKLEEVTQGRMQLGQHTHHGRTGGGGEGDERASTNADETEELTEASKNVTSWNAALVKSFALQKNRPGPPSEVAAQQKSPRQSPPAAAAAPPNASLLSDTKPKNRMQMLDALRSSALMGKKRRR